MENVFAFLRRKSFYIALLALAGLVNAAGYVLSLWHDETVFDELVHLFTTFAVTAALGKALATKRATRPSTRFGVQLVGLALALGLLWEAFEWLIGMVGSRHDTLMDLAMDLAGATLAAIFIPALFADKTSTKS